MSALSKRSRHAETDNVSKRRTHAEAKAADQILNALRCWVRRHTEKNIQTKNDTETETACSNVHVTRCGDSD